VNDAVDAAEEAETLTVIARLTFPEPALLLTVKLTL
jgi:hypothetical protein